MHDCQLDGDSPRRRDERRTATRSRIDNRLDRLRRVGAFNIDLIGDSGESSFNFPVGIAAASFDKPDISPSSLLN